MDKKRERKIGRQAGRQTERDLGVKPCLPSQCSSDVSINVNRMIKVGGTRRDPLRTEPGVNGARAGGEVARAQVLLPVKDFPQPVQERRGGCRGV